MTVTMEQPTAHANSELLGEVVGWRMDRSEVAYQEVLDALAKANLPQEVAHELSPRSAFGRACADLKKDRVIDKVKTEGGIIRFQFTQKHLVNDKIDHVFECMVELDADTGKIECPANEALAVQARQLFAYCHQMRNAQDVTRCVQKLFKEHADLFPLIPSKGVAYFVPEEHREFTTKVDQFLKEMGGSLCRFPVPKGTETGNQSVQQAVQGGLRDMLAELQEKIDNWDTTTREATIQKAKDEWDAVSYKVSVYSHYLSTKHTELEDELKAAQQRLADKIFSIGEEKEAAKIAAEDAEAVAAEPELAAV